MDLDRDACYRALSTRDARFDGRFFTAVRTTGIFCRPICPARTPKLENCIFLPSAAAAHQMGFRPCLRCRPEVAPGVAVWRGSASTVSRALHLIAEGAMDEAGVDALADRLGVGARHLRRLFDQHVGASPISVAQTHRILFAKTLINETQLSMTDVALAAGFGSVRRFNAVMQATYNRPPRELRRTAKSAGAADEAAGVTLKLPFNPPYDWAAMVEFLAPRAIPGVEQVEASRYRRSFALDTARGVVEVRPAPGQNHLLATIHTNDIAALATIVARLRRLFDLDADIAAIDAHLAADPMLARSGCASVRGCACPAPGTALNWPCARFWASRSASELRPPSPGDWSPPTASLWRPSASFAKDPIGCSRRPRRSLAPTSPRSG